MGGSKGVSKPKSQGVLWVDQIGWDGMGWVLLSSR